MVDIPKLDGNINWVRDKKCKYVMNKTIRDVLAENNMNKTDSNSNNWVFYFPCTYNRIDDEIKNILSLETKNLSDKRFFLVSDADELVSKQEIWKNLVQYFGRQKAQKIMPTTYILSNEYDMQLFNDEYNLKKIYIMKKNVQRQTGLKITNKKSDIENGLKNKYVIAQELLQDPYLIDGRKINMRFYLLIICKGDETDAYVHKEGFVYYTKENFKKNSLRDDPNITTGYIDRHVYKINPLTHGDFRKYLDNKKRSLTNVEVNLLKENTRLSDLFFNRTYKLLANVVDSVSHVICKHEDLKNSITFQIFGADIAVNNKLEPQLMELNKGPDMGAKDKRDKEVKYSVIRDMFKVHKAIDNNDDNDHGFIKIKE